MKPRVGASIVRKLIAIKARALHVAALGAIAALLWQEAASAAQLVATRPIRAGEILRASDIEVRDLAAALPGIAEAPSQVVGKEVRASLYPGRPIRLADLGPITVVRRNALVTLTFRRGRLLIRGAGRALDDGGIGQTIRVMNLDSRLTVFGRIVAEGQVEVGGAH